MKFNKQLAFIVAGLLFSITSQAASFVWTPAVGTSPYAWSAGGNWKVGTVVQTVPSGASLSVAVTGV